MRERRVIGAIFESCQVERWEIQKGKEGVDDGSREGRRSKHLSSTFHPSFLSSVPSRLPSRPNLLLFSIPSPPSHIASSMIPPRTLSSLPSDVLLEILSHLLVDTSPESNRASVLRTCSLLYELGLPLLYRVVELRGFSTRALVLEHWRRLFGEGGLLIEGGRKEELARMVKEIRLGGEANFPPQDYYGDKDKVMEKGTF